MFNSQYFAQKCVYIESQKLPFFGVNRYNEIWRVVLYEFEKKMSRSIKDMIESGELRPMPQLYHYWAITDVAFGADGTFLASSGAGGLVLIYCLEREMLLQTLFHAGSVHKILFHPDDGHILYTLQRDTLTAWNWVQGKRLGEYACKDEAPFEQVAYHEKSFSLLCTHVHCKKPGISSWYILDDGALAEQERKTLPNRAQMGGIERSYLSQDGSVWAIITEFQFQLEIWSVDTWTQEQVLMLSPGINELAISPDNRLLASCGIALSIKFWELQGAQRPDYAYQRLSPV